LQTAMYARDLAYVHDRGFSGFSRRAAPALIGLLRARGLPRGVVVEVGCGGATLARALADAGYAMHGIDPAPAMIRIAPPRVPDGTCRVGSLTGAALPRCVAVISIGEVVSYVPEPSAAPMRLASFFARVRRALLPGGLFVFDFLESAAGRTYDRKVRHGSDWT